LTREELLALDFSNITVDVQDLNEDSEEDTFWIGGGGGAFLNSACGVTVVISWSEGGEGRSREDACFYDVQFHPEDPDYLTLEGATLVNEDGDPLDEAEVKTTLRAVADQYDWKQEIVNHLPSAESAEMAV
jgi:hypothetical protein